MNFILIKAFNWQSIFRVNCCTRCCVNYLIVINKVDSLNQKQSEILLDKLSIINYQISIKISAKDKTGIDDLKNQLLSSEYDVLKNSLQMEYTNFKSQVYATRGSDFTHALSSVWSTMHEVEDESARI